MKVGRVLLAAMLVASVATTAMAQGRGGILQRRSDALTEQQRQTLRNLQERQRKEMSELRSRHREQMERALPPAARERLQERRSQLQRQGRLMERQQLMRRRNGGLQERRDMALRGRLQSRPGPDSRRGPLQLRGGMNAPRNRGGVLPPDSGGVRGRVRDGR